MDRQTVIADWEAFAATKEEASGEASPWALACARLTAADATVRRELAEAEQPELSREQDDG